MGTLKWLPWERASYLENIHNRWMWMSQKPHLPDVKLVSLFPATTATLSLNA